MKMKGTSGRVQVHALRVAFLVGLIGVTAKADVWVSGAICTESYAFSGNVLDHSHGAVNPSANEVYVACPIPVDQNVGTSQEFQVRVEDSHTTQNFACTGVIYSTNGEILATTGTDTTAGVLEDTLTFSVTTGSSSDDYSYVAYCNVPGNSSKVENLRVY